MAANSDKPQFFVVVKIISKLIEVKVRNYFLVFKNQLAALLYGPQYQRLFGGSFLLYLQPLEDS